MGGKHKKIYTDHCIFILASMDDDKICVLCEESLSDGQPTISLKAKKGVTSCNDYSRKRKLGVVFSVSRICIYIKY